MYCVGAGGRLPPLRGSIAESAVVYVGTRKGRPYKYGYSMFNTKSNSENWI